MTPRHHPRSQRRRCAALAATAIALVAPAAASAATSLGTVLLVDQRQHHLELVGSHESVLGYRYAGRLSKVGFGSRIAYRASGRFLHVVRVRGRRTSHVSFLARVVVVGSSRVVLRLTDGTEIAFGRKAVTLPNLRPAPGHTVLATETASGGRKWLLLVATASLAGSGRAPSGTPSGAPSNGNPSGIPGNGSPTGVPSNSNPFEPTGPESTGSGAVLVESDTDHVVLTMPDGSTVNALLPPAALTYINHNSDIWPCQVISFAYHQSPGGPVLDSFTPTGMSTSARIYVPADHDTCADENGGTTDVVGPITALASHTLAVTVPGVAPLTLSFDPTSGIATGAEVGDLVDVTYAPDLIGTLVASNISWPELYTTGKVTTVGSDSFTIKDAVTGGYETFVPNDADFTPVSHGDVVSVTYYVSAGQLEADNISDYTAGTNT
jgi:hypothetical protein